MVIIISFTHMNKTKTFKDNFYTAVRQDISFINRKGQNDFTSCT